MDQIFRALADPSRRRLLDRLRERDGLSLGELCEGLDMARQSVTKHLRVLETAGLVTTTRDGRRTLHHLDVAPINDVADRWIGRYSRERVQALADLRTTLEERGMPDGFRYTTYIRTTPEALWRALVDPAFTLRYWGVALRSDWREGSRVLWQEGEDAPPQDQGSVVLVCDPPRRLSYTWQSMGPAHAELFGLTDVQAAAMRTERRSKVTFELEPAGEAVKLTVVHDDFDPGSLMLEAVSGRTPQSGGWPELLADLKTLLETGRVMREPAAAG